MSDDWHIPDDGTQLMGNPVRNESADSPQGHTKTLPGGIGQLNASKMGGQNHILQTSIISARVCS